MQPFYQTHMDIGVFVTGTKRLICRFTAAASTPTTDFICREYNYLSNSGLNA